MSDNFTISLVRTFGHGAVLLLVFNMITPAAAASPTPPSQIAALSFAYHTVTGHTCGQGDDSRDCAAQGLRQAIIRSDYRVRPNGMASVWLELLTQTQTASHTPAPIIHTTVELEILSTPEGDLVTTATRTLSTETRGPETDLQAALVETRLRGLVYRWLMHIEQPANDASALLVHTHSSTTLDPATGPRLTGHRQISNWFTSQQQRQTKIQQQIDVIDIKRFTARRYRLDFAVNWQGRGTNGALRIGRKEYRWEVELGTDDTVRITHIQERDALPLPDMGTRVFC